MSHFYLYFPTADSLKGKLFMVGWDYYTHWIDMSFLFCHFWIISYAIKEPVGLVTSSCSTWQILMFPDRTISPHFTLKSIHFTFNSTQQGLFPVTKPQWFLNVDCFVTHTKAIDFDLTLCVIRRQRRFLIMRLRKHTQQDNNVHHQSKTNTYTLRLVAWLQLDI